MKVILGALVLFWAIFFILHSKHSHRSAEIDEDNTSQSQLGAQSGPSTTRPAVRTQERLSPSKNVNQNQAAQNQFGPGSPLNNTNSNPTLGASRESPEYPGDTKVKISPNLVTRISGGHQVAGVQQEMVANLAKQMNVPPSQLQVYSPESNFPGEVVVPSSTLSFVNCEALDSFAAPLTLRVDGSGYITEMASLVPGVTAPPLAQASSCQVQGGPSEPFVTTRFPAAANP